MLRKDKDFSLNDLSGSTGISVSALSRWESGNRIPDVQRFEKVLDALGYRLVIVKC